MNDDWKEFRAAVLAFWQTLVEAWHIEQAMRQADKWLRAVSRKAGQ